MSTYTPAGFVLNYQWDVKKKNLSVTENWEFSFQFPSHLVVKVSREAEALIVIMNETN